MKSQLPTSIADKHKGINETDQKMMKMASVEMKEQMKIIQAEQETNENTIKKLKEDLEKSQKARKEKDDELATINLQLKQANNSLKWERGLVKSHARELAKMRSTSNAGAISRVSSRRLPPTMLTHVCRPTISSGFGVAQAVQTDEGKAESIALHERVRVDEATQTTMVRHVVAV
ncbi:MAG: hypothetical protein SGPRY_011315 [Prymnesium sp.]